MARLRRLELPNATYYVMNRASPGCKLFESPKDYEVFQQTIKKVCDAWSLDALAYCLLPNQYHLLLHTREANLSRAIQQLNSAYAYHLIKDNKVNGPVFRKRYKATLIEDRLYGKKLVAYLNQLPYLRRTVPEVETYPWMSEIPANLGVTASEINDVNSIFEQARWPKILGTLPFKAQIRKRLLEDPISVMPRIPEHELISLLVEMIGISWGDVRAPKTREQREARRISILAFRRFMKWDYRRLGEYFQVSNIANISRIVNQKQVGASEILFWRDVEEKIQSQFRLQIEGGPRVESVVA